MKMEGGIKFKNKKREEEIQDGEGSISTTPPNAKVGPAKGKPSPAH